MNTNKKPVAVAAICVLLLLEATGCSTSTSSTYFDYCEEPISDEECYALRRDPDSDEIALATDIALRYIEEHPAPDELWDWTSGVLMFALTELHRVTDDDALRAYYQEYLDHHIEEGYNIVWSDSCPPALTALALLAEEDDADYEKVVADVLAYLEDAPRTDEGGISHLGAGLLPFTSIWVDSLFMFGMVLNRHGEAVDDTAALTLMSEQLRIFSEVLQDEGGLLVHADDWVAEFDDDIYWARGNGWVTVSMADYLRIRFLRGESDPQAERMFRKQVDGALATHDTDSGMWWTVTNRPGEGANYRETSATALFAYGMARAYRYGLVGQTELDAAKSAVEAVKGAVEYDEQGRPFVTGISAGTSPSTFEGYTEIPLENDLNYGVGAAILALIERSGL